MLAEKRKNGSVRSAHQFRKGYSGKKLPAKIVPPKGPAASVPVQKKKAAASS